MPRHISAVDARRRLGALLDDVSTTGAEYVIERNGKPTAAVVPIRVYEQHITGRRNAFDRVEALKQRLTKNTTGQDLEDAIDDAAESVPKQHKELKSNDPRQCNCTTYRPVPDSENEMAEDAIDDATESLRKRRE